MILIGDKNIPYETISKISTIEDIKDTKSNSTLVFDFDIDILKYTSLNDLSVAVKVANITELIYSSNLDAKYIIPDNDILNKSQELADHYMFDSKILALIRSAHDIENIAISHIDGVIYEEVIR